MNSSDLYSPKELLVQKYRKLRLNSFNMAESEETGLKLQDSFEESDSDSSFEVIEDPTNPKVSTQGFLCMHLARLIFHFVFWTRNFDILQYVVVMRSS